MRISWVVQWQDRHGNERVEFPTRELAAGYVRHTFARADIQDVTWTCRREEDTLITRQEFTDGTFDEWIKE